MLHAHLTLLKFICRIVRRRWNLMCMDYEPVCRSFLSSMSKKEEKNSKLTCVMRIWRTKLSFAITMLIRWCDVVILNCLTNSAQNFHVSAFNQGFSSTFDTLGCFLMIFQKQKNVSKTDFLMNFSLLWVFYFLFFSQSFFFTDSA